jgi:hypothetical protein
MKRSAFVRAFILALLFSTVAGAQFIHLGVADPFVEERWTTPPVISLNSPMNKTYTSSVPLNFTVTKPESWLSEPVSFAYEPGSGLAQELLSVSYYIDEKFYGLVSSNSNLSSPFNYFVYLKNLTDGGHSLIVLADATGVVRNYISSSVYHVPINSSSDLVYFTLDATPPSVSVLSVENKTYEKSDVQLNFTVSEAASKITYSLDEGDNVTITGNTTLSGLSEGAHSITVYAWDMAGNIATPETISFSVKVPEPFPTTVVIASIGSVAIVGLGLLVYFKKRQKGPVDNG